MLTQKGLKITDIRLAILRILAATELPLDVTEIEQKLAKKDVQADQVTVYRTLDTLVKHGLVRRVDFHEGKFRYELAGEDHHHLICENCGKIQDVEDCPVDELERSVGKKQGFQVKHHSLEFFGLCASCQ